jgi:hypothetical protein
LPLLSLFQLKSVFPEASVAQVTFMVDWKVSVVKPSAPQLLAEVM